MVINFFMWLRWNKNCPSFRNFKFLFDGKTKVLRKNLERGLSWEGQFFNWWDRKQMNGFRTISCAGNSKIDFYSLRIAEELWDREAITTTGDVGLIILIYVWWINKADWLRRWSRTIPGCSWFLGWLLGLRAIDHQLFPTIPFASRCWSVCTWTTNALCSEILLRWEGWKWQHQRRLVGCRSSWRSGSRSWFTSWPDTWCCWRCW